MNDIHQMGIGLNVYTGQYNDKLPVLTSTGGPAWVWDMPDSAAQLLLKSGMDKSTFYCPGTAPKFTDLQNWAGPNPSGLTTGANSTLWGFGMTQTTPFHVVGYAFAFSGSDILNRTNWNRTLQPETITDSVMGTTVTYGVSDRILVADAILSTGSVQPGYAHPENQYASIPGGFMWNGVVYPHTSPHLNGTVPAGGFAGFKDAHVEWHLFQDMVPRTTSGSVFWW
jgi:hypothetical protein